jgi:hypothetical protein
MRLMNIKTKDMLHQNSLLLIWFYTICFHLILGNFIWYCQGHKNAQEQRLKERFKSNFQTRNKTKLCDSKLRNTRIKNKNMKCARPTWKQVFIMLTYANMNIKRTWQAYSVKLCLRLLLSRLKKMKGLTFIYTPLGT